MEDARLAEMLMECDFSKKNTGHKARLKQALAACNRELSEDKLEWVSAAAAPPMPTFGMDEENERKNR
jgi:hypothetical protein